MKFNSFASFFKGPTFFQFVILAVLLGIFILLGQVKSPEKQSAYLLLNLNGQKRAFEGGVSDNMTVFDAIEASALAGNIKLGYLVQNDSAILITQLSNFKIPKNPASFYLNSNKIDPEQINATSLKPGDSVEVNLKQ